VLVLCALCNSSVFSVNRCLGKRIRMNKKRVLFLCTGNSCRSQMAEGLTNHILAGCWQAYSAGTRPEGYVHPLAVEVMAELGIDISHQRSKSTEEVRGMSFDLVITLCDDAAQHCPLWLGQEEKVHISFEDPAQAKGRLDAKLNVYRRVRDNMRKSVIAYLQQLDAGDAAMLPVAASQPLPGRKPGTERPMRTHFQQELRHLQDELLVTGSMVTQALRDSLDILKRQDLDHARQLIADDRLINQKRYAIENDCLTLIATQQPMARDMRLIAGIMEIASELERIGDYAKGIGRITLYIGREPLVKPLVHMPQMCDIVVEMLRDALDAFITQDAQKAREIPKRDDAVDTLYNTINRELIDVIVANPKKIDNANYLSWAAHNLERAADRVTNICERVIYTETGEFIELDEKEPGLAGVTG
jgi:phosphate transport system protein